MTTILKRATERFEAVFLLARTVELCMCALRATRRPPVVVGEEDEEGTKVGGSTAGGTAPYAYSVSAGAVPAGTTLNTSTGTVSGSPTTGSSFSYTVQVTNSDGATATAPSSGTMASALSLTATPSTDTEVGASYSRRIRRAVAPRLTSTR
jgi:hypothetical protein